jgi:hypothetical protein
LKQTIINRNQSTTTCNQLHYHPSTNQPTQTAKLSDVVTWTNTESAFSVAGGSMQQPTRINVDCLCAAELVC